MVVPLARGLLRKKAPYRSSKLSYNTSSSKLPRTSRSTFLSLLSKGGRTPIPPFSFSFSLKSRPLLLSIKGSSRFSPQNQRSSRFSPQKNKRIHTSPFLCSLSHLNLETWGSGLLDILFNKISPKAKVGNTIKDEMTTNSFPFFFP